MKTLHNILQSIEHGEYEQFDVYMNNIYLYVDGSTTYTEDPKYSWKDM